MEHLVSPGDTVLLTSQNTPEALFWVALQPPLLQLQARAVRVGAQGERGFQTFLILWLLALVTTLWPAA